MPLDDVAQVPMLTPRSEGYRAEARPLVVVRVRREPDVERWVALVEALMAVRLEESA
jgi:hypothetical protein